MSVPTIAPNASTDLSMTNIPLSERDILTDMPNRDRRQDFAANSLRRFMRDRLCLRARYSGRIKSERPQVWRVCTLKYRNDVVIKR